MEKNKNYILIDCASVDNMDAINYIVVDTKNKRFALLSEEQEIEDISELWIKIQCENYRVCEIVGTIVNYYAIDCMNYPTKSTRQVEINDINYLQYEHMINFSDLLDFIDNEINNGEYKTLKEIKEEIL